MTTVTSRLTRLAPLFLLCLALAACGGDKAPSEGGGSEHADEHGHEHEGKHGGVIVESSDHSMHFEIAHDEGAGLVKLWLYDGDMNPVTTSEIPVINIPGDTPVQIKGACPKGGTTATEWHFSHDALAGHVHEARIRVLATDRSYMVDFPHEDHDGHEHDDHDGHDHDDGHEHDDHGDHGDHDHAHEGEGPHHGLVRAFLGDDGTVAGYLELKLHDDKGDLELWLAEDEGMKKPFDLTLNAKVTVTFTSMRDKQVTLQVRNREKNEDEDGVANNRDGNTNYFVFPGATGADAAWLQGKAFKATVTVSFGTTKGDFQTKPFELTPHTH